MSDNQHQEPFADDESMEGSPRRPLLYWVLIALVGTIITGVVLGIFFAAFPENEWLPIPPTGIYHDAAPQFFTNPLFWLIFAPIVGIIFLAPVDRREHVGMRVIALIFTGIGFIITLLMYFGPLDRIEITDPQQQLQIRAINGIEISERHIEDLKYHPEVMAARERDLAHEQLLSHYQLTLTDGRIVPADTFTRMVGGLVKQDVIRIHYGPLDSRDFVVRQYIIKRYQPKVSTMQYKVTANWITISNKPNPDPDELKDVKLLALIKFKLGADGMSMPMILLNGLLSFIALIASFGIKKRVKEYLVWYLLLTASVFGIFCSLDLFLFFLFFELMLVPMYFLIGVWGGPRREYAALKFFLYSLAGGVFMLVGILWLYYQTGKVFDLELLRIVGPELSRNVQIGVWILMFVGFAVKVPIFPFHTWLPDAHVEAPTPISVILAGILLKIGAYGFLRCMLPVVPEGTAYFASFLAVLGMINIVYGAFVAMAQDDMKKLVAYSSISHMGYVILGFAAGNDFAMNGALLQMFNHGIISGSLFLLVGVIYDRAHTRGLDEFGGVAYYMPQYAYVMYLCGMANLGLPALAGFWGEFFSLAGAWMNESWMRTVQFFGIEVNLNMYHVIVAVSVIGIVITAGYMLMFIKRVFLGMPNPKWKDVLKGNDLTVREAITLIPLSVLILYIGVYPWPLIEIFSQTIKDFVVRY